MQHPVESPTARTAFRWTPWGWVTAVAALIFLTLLGLPATTQGRQWVHRIDARYLGERIMDTLARLRSGEDWSTAAPLRPGQNYAWLQAGDAPVRIAHALGEAGMPTANTLGAAKRAYAAGFRLLEVDLIQEAGQLQCQHDPGPQDGLMKDGCTLDTLLAALPQDAWLVLDIKANFAAVGQRIVDDAIRTGDAGRLVFQLYRPEDFTLFNRWQAQAPLPGPILTAYLAHRRIDHVASHAGRIGVGAFTLPLDRLPALSVRPQGVAVLTHPVRNCDSWKHASAGAQGVYTLSSLRCGTARSLPLP